MKVKQLKSLIKHIMSEAQTPEKGISEMIANKNVEPDVFGAVNVEEINGDTTKDGKPIYAIGAPGSQKRNMAVSDPTHDQMYSYLKSAYGTQEGFNDEAEMAIYWFANFNHGGQSSNLYKVLSASPYRPGPIAKGPEKNTTEEIMYKALEARYGGKQLKENEDSEEKLKGKFVERGEVKLEGGIDYKLAEKIANHLWDVFGSLGKDERGVYNFKTRGERFCCAVGMLNGKPAILSVTTTPGRLQLLVGDEIGLEGVSEQSGSGAAGAFSTPMAFKKRKIRESSFLDKVKAKLQNVEEKITSDGRYIDDMLDGGRMKRAEGMPEGVDEVSGTRYFAEIPVGSTFKIPGETVVLKKIGPGHANVVSSDKKKTKIKIPNDQRANIVDTDLDETSTSGAVFSGGPAIATPNWGTKNKLGSSRAIDVTKKMGFKVVKSITTENGNDYKPINTAPKDKLLFVRWGDADKAEHGVAKYAHGKWWNYTSSNPHARGKECAAPTGWSKEYNLSEKKR